MNKTLFTTNNKKYILPYILFVLVFLYIFWKSPYCHDEWAWGIPSQLELLKNGFDGYNGRYLGNILALIITRSILAKSLILTLILVFLLVVMKKLITKNNPACEGRNYFLFLLTLLLLLAIPKSLFNQTYGWSAAYVNFIPPVPLFLYYYYKIEDVTIYRNDQLKTKTLVLLFVTCFCAQLFSEHNTILHVLFSFGVLIYGYVKYKKINKSNVILFCAFLAGALVMFSNNSYHAAMNDAHEYKHISFSLLSSLKYYANNMGDPLILNNWILNCILIICCVRLIIKKVKNRYLAIELLTVLVGYGTYSIWQKVYPAWSFLFNDDFNNYVKSTLGILFFLHVAFTIFITIEKDHSIPILMWYFLSAIVAMPLVVADPIGPRCFYVSYIFQAITCLLLISYCLPEKADYFYVTALSIMAALTISIVYVWMFRAIGMYNDARAFIIADARQNNQKSISLPYLPYSDYCWHTVPPSEQWMKRFRIFYGIDPDVEITFFSDTH